MSLEGEPVAAGIADALASLSNRYPTAFQQVQTETGSSGLETNTVLAVAAVVALVAVAAGFLVGVRRARRERQRRRLEKADDRSPREPGEVSDADRDPSIDPEPEPTDDPNQSPVPTTADTGAAESAGAVGSDRHGEQSSSTANDQSSRSSTLGLANESTVGHPPETIGSAPEASFDYDELTEEELIGSGGNADVYRATLPQSTGDHTLAVKKPRLTGTLHAETIDRMLDEAETWDKLDDHDHVVGVVDYGDAPLPWIAMEYMDGGQLGERAGDLPAEQALWTAIGVTKAVRHAHRRGVAHLDLKPENVLFQTHEDAWDVPKVSDWGLSKHLLDHSATVEGVTPDYAAPEQFDESRGPVDDVTDVYQLGAVFYELFTGRPPFEGTLTEVMRAVMDDDPTPPSEVADVPDGLDDVLLTALAKDREDRYESTLYLRDALQDVADGR